MPSQPVSPPHLSPALAAVGCALVLVACGGAGSKPAVAASNPELAISQCMRAHGVPNFPDPTKGPGGVGMSINSSPGSSTLTVEGIPFSGPAFQAAEKTCKLFGGGTSPPPISESEKIALFHFSQCMRAHGVPDYPDPVFPAGGGIERPSGPGISKESPAVRQAAAVCHRR
jgi:hypothetical protein